MPNFYAEILRGPIGFHDNNFKPLASNDPSTSTLGWVKGSGVTATSDGDIVTFSGTTGINSFSYFPLSINTTTYPYIVLRIKGTGTVVVTTGGSGMNKTVSLNGSWQTITLQQPASATTTSIVFSAQSNPNIQLHSVYVCGKTPIQLSQTDLEMGTVTRMAFGFDSAYLRLNNQAGKFVTGANTVGFGDHLHIYLPRYGDATGQLYHSYGGYCEVVEPFQPNIEVNILGRGYGLGPGRTIHLNSYQNKTPQFILNDIVDNSINAASKNGVPIKLSLIHI